MDETLAIQQLVRPDGATIAYHQTPGTSPGVIYLSGFRADMSGNKASYLEKWCREKGRAFIRFDYFGHGASSGKFVNGFLGRWKNDALAVLDELTVGPQILVGSSMGGWIMLLLALARPERIKGLVGIAPAPDFTKDILYKLKQNYKDELLSKGVCYVPSYPGDAPYPITMKLIEESAKYHVLDNPIPIHCPVRLLHGMNDSDVPWQQSVKLMNALESNDVQINLIKKANHRLSAQDNLFVLGKTLDSFF
jgi:pimeloyl-ACP methyl ester carboxylesterase